MARLTDACFIIDPCSTYRGPNEKREGAGPHNWGSMADDAGFVLFTSLTRALVYSFGC